MTVLSGTVTSSIITALSVHEPAVEYIPAVPSGVLGVVVEASGVDVAGVAVGKEKLIFVGGNVEVTKRDGVGGSACWEILRQELRLRQMSRVRIQIFFITEILLGNY
jgi:hypothetical protein